MTLYAVALGSNLGDRLHNLGSAVSALAGLGEVTALSGIYEAAPVGGPDQRPYLNAVAVLESELAPHPLLGELQAIERAQGRERTVRWGPRTLDLDIVASDGEAVSDPGLEIPHPRAIDRRFVLEPLSEVWPDVRVGPGVTARMGLERVADQDVDLLARRWADPAAISEGRYWVAAQLVIFLAIAVVLATDGTFPGEAPEGPRLIGALLVLVGALLALFSLRRLGRPLTPMPEPAQGRELVETGPYALARHPIYGGVSLFLLGTALVLDSLPGVLLSLGLLVFFWLKTTYEERRLRIAYPGYREYRQRVPRRLIPFVM